uniref:Uncharacterized protein n=1 Tax=Chionoecetes opilio bacilliform virus TaxID=1825681 RepID=A0A1Q3DKS4_9VIRU|nr:wsv143-like protein [Chionoecetes opilio bacilliform virus]GAV93146.1 hypothetical protein SCV_022 [Chionoecetes opilio bacilliform virus]
MSGRRKKKRPQKKPYYRRTKDVTDEPKGLQGSTHKVQTPEVMEDDVAAVMDVEQNVVETGIKPIKPMTVVDKMRKKRRDAAAAKKREESMKNVEETQEPISPKKKDPTDVIRTSPQVTPQTAQVSKASQDIMDTGEQGVSVGAEKQRMEVKKKRKEQRSAKATQNREASMGTIGSPTEQVETAQVTKVSQDNISTDAAVDIMDTREQGVSVGAEKPAVDIMAEKQNRMEVNKKRKEQRSAKATQNRGASMGMESVKRPPQATEHAPPVSMEIEDLQVPTETGVLQVPTETGVLQVPTETGTGVLQVSTETGALQGQQAHMEIQYPQASQNQEVKQTTHVENMDTQQTRSKRARDGDDLGSVQASMDKAGHPEKRTKEEVKKMSVPEVSEGKKYAVGTVVMSDGIEEDTTGTPGAEKPEFRTDVVEETAVMMASDDIEDVSEEDVEEKAETITLSTVEEATPVVEEMAEVAAPPEKIIEKEKKEGYSSLEEEKAETIAPPEKIIEKEKTVEEATPVVEEMAEADVAAPPEKIIEKEKTVEEATPVVEEMAEAVDVAAPPEKIIEKEKTVEEATPVVEEMPEAVDVAEKREGHSSSEEGGTGVAGSDETSRKRGYEEKKEEDREPPPPKKGMVGRESEDVGMTGILDGDAAGYAERDDDTEFVTLKKKRMVGRESEDVRTIGTPDGDAAGSDREEEMEAVGDFVLYQKPRKKKKRKKKIEVMMEETLNEKEGEMPKKKNNGEEKMEDTVADAAVSMEMKGVDTESGDTKKRKKKEEIKEKVNEKEEEAPKRKKKTKDRRWENKADAASIGEKIDVGDATGEMEAESGNEKKSLYTKEEPPKKKELDESEEDVVEVATNDVVDTLNEKDVGEDTIESVRATGAIPKKRSDASVKRKKLRPIEETPRKKKLDKNKIEEVEEEKMEAEKEESDDKDEMEEEGVGDTAQEEEEITKKKELDEDKMEEEGVEGTVETAMVVEDANVKRKRATSQEEEEITKKKELDEDKMEEIERKRRKKGYRQQNVFQDDSGKELSTTIGTIIRDTISVMREHSVLSDESIAMVERVIVKNRDIHAERTPDDTFAILVRHIEMKFAQILESFSYLSVIIWSTEFVKAKKSDYFQEELNQLMTGISSESLWNRMKEIGITAELINGDTPSVKMGGFKFPLKGVNFKDTLLINPHGDIGVAVSILICLSTMERNAIRVNESVMEFNIGGKKDWDMMVYRLNITVSLFNIIYQNLGNLQRMKEYELQITTVWYSIVRERYYLSVIQGLIEGGASESFQKALEEIGGLMNVELPPQQQQIGDPSLHQLKKIIESISQMSGVLQLLLSSEVVMREVEDIYIDKTEFTGPPSAPSAPPPQSTPTPDRGDPTPSPGDGSSESSGKPTALPSESSGKPTALPGKPTAPPPDPPPSPGDAYDECVRRYITKAAEGIDILKKWVQTEFKALEQHFAIARTDTEELQHMQARFQYFTRNTTQKFYLFKEDILKVAEHGIITICKDQPHSWAIVVIRKMFADAYDIMYDQYDEFSIRLHKSLDLAKDIRTESDAGNIKNMEIANDDEKARLDIRKKARSDLNSVLTWTETSLGTSTEISPYERNFETYGQDGEEGESFNLKDYLEHPYSLKKKYLPDFINEFQTDQQNVSEKVNLLNTLPRKVDRTIIVPRHGINTQSYPFYMKKISMLGSDVDIDNNKITHPEYFRPIINDNGLGRADISKGVEIPRLQLIASDMLQTLTDTTSDAFEQQKQHIGGGVGIPWRLNMLIFNIFDIDHNTIKLISIACFRFRGFIRTMHGKEIGEGKNRSSLLESTVATLFTACRHVWRTVVAADQHNNPGQNRLFELVRVLEMNMAAISSRPAHIEKGRGIGGDEIRVHACYVMLDYLNQYLKLCLTRIEELKHILDVSTLTEKKIMYDVKNIKSVVIFDTIYDFSMLARLLIFQENAVTLLLNDGINSWKISITGLTMFNVCNDQPISSTLQKTLIPLNSDAKVIILSDNNDDYVHILTKIYIYEELIQMLSHSNMWASADAEEKSTESSIEILRGLNGILMFFNEEDEVIKENNTAMERLCKGEEIVNLGTTVSFWEVKHKNIKEKIDSLVSQKVELEKKKKLYDEATITNTLFASSVVRPGTIASSSVAYVRTPHYIQNAVSLRGGVNLSMWSTSFFLAPNGDNTHLKDWEKLYNNDTLLMDVTDTSVENNTENAGLLIPPNEYLTYKHNLRKNVRVSTDVPEFGLRHMAPTISSLVPTTTPGDDMVLKIGKARYIEAALGVTVSLMGNDVKHSAAIVMNALKHNTLNFTRPVFDTRTLTNTHYESPKIILMPRQKWATPLEPTVHVSNWNVPSIRLLHQQIQSLEGYKVPVNKEKENEVYIPGILGSSVHNLQECLEYGHVSDVERTEPSTAIMSSLHPYVDVANAVVQNKKLNRKKTEGERFAHLINDMSLAPALLRRSSTTIGNDVSKTCGVFGGTGQIPTKREIGTNRTWWVSEEIDDKFVQDVSIIAHRMVILTPSLLDIHPPQLS